LELISSRDTTNFSVETLLVCYRGLRSKVRWKDNVEDDIREMGVVNRTEVGHLRDGGRRATRKALIVLGC
jgi:ribosomal protein S5